MSQGVEQMQSVARRNGKPLQQELQRIETLVRTIESAADPNVRASAIELMQTLMSFHSEGIERMMEIVADSGGIGDAMIDDFARDEVVANLLMLYGLHPLEMETRVLQALDKVRPYLHSHGGDVELIEIADGKVRLGLRGSCHGCASSAITLRSAIEEAIYEAAPDLTALEVEGVVNQPVASSGLVQLQKAPGRVSA